MIIRCLLRGQTLRFSNSVASRILIGAFRLRRGRELPDQKHQISGDWYVTLAVADRYRSGICVVLASTEQTIFDSSYYHLSFTMTSTNGQIPSNVGFVGLGNMGFPMFCNLSSKLPSTSTVHYYDISQESMERANKESNASAKLDPCSSAREVIEKSVSASIRHGLAGCIN